MVTRWFSVPKAVGKETPKFSPPQASVSITKEGGLFYLVKCSGTLAELESFEQNPGVVRLSDSLVETIFQDLTTVGRAKSEIDLGFTVS